MSKLLKLLPYILVKDKFKAVDNSDQIGKAVSAPPPVYNQYGEEYKVFYLCDTININTPYSLSREVNPRRIYGTDIIFHLILTFMLTIACLKDFIQAAKDMESCVNLSR